MNTGEFHYTREALDAMDKTEQRSTNSSLAKWIMGACLIAFLGVKYINAKYGGPKQDKPKPKKEEKE